MNDTEPEVVRAAGVRRNSFTVIAAGEQDITNELLNFANWIGLEQKTSGRCSILLILGLFAGFASRILNPAKILHEIEILEGAAGPSRTKPAAPFRDPPLKGLWHKHYQRDSLRSMAINLKRGIQRDGLPILEEWTEEIRQTGQERILSGEDCGALANEAVMGNWVRLSEACEITGEWIVYARHGNVNYYLCLGNHDRKGHTELRKQIEAICFKEFPFLSDLICDA